MNEFELGGLDGQNPLAVFAALGLLRVLDAHARRERLERPRLWFVDAGAPIARVRADLEDVERLVELVLADARARAEDPVLSLRYDDQGVAVERGADGTGDLKPAPTTAKQLLEQVAQGPRDHADTAAACFSELVQDNNGNTKPTAFHFTAGQQAFLEMVEDLRAGIGDADVREALFGPWIGASQAPSLSWDATVARQYALRAGNPSKEKRGSVPGANWLAVLGLACFPVNVRNDRLVTSCVEGGWKDAVFTWPIWSSPASYPSVGALMRIDTADLQASERAALGLRHVFASRILRSDQGGYGSFTPATVVLPRTSSSSQH